MRRIGLLVWTGGLAATAVLLAGGGWPSGGDPAATVMAAVRLAACALAAYLAVATAVAVVAEVTPHRAVARVAAVLTTRSLRRAVALLIGTGLLAAPAPAPAEPRPRPPADAPVLRRVVEPPPAAPVAAPPAAVPVAEPVVDVVEVRPGDHVWSISERALAARLGRRPTDAETAPYWLAVIEANRSQLADPDLVFPGQRLALPSSSA